ncbi:MAG: hypothetical protein A3G32_04570 [Deltaproteobacteria bacterium RIFCSPLOWO2_12_FULL_40_28]|nr:MAG: hypothetical protein A3C45_08680 [Deltaproteobacteria bacterium RIFCSPHIGHO2_02_FULL_40_28]OGQ19644.1 MAG: hypothetical protein A3E27_07875 [Deltaproteobacteria bacterium RIFCSPHIGHO2_12_FULL_40_32]OGQ40921.1 MAG: hypothetical protein A3I69_03290 [Deltaproteobacteria bacterium RIFCSPLOWO2_02_FULL_40_36]OGQ54036.1 MAG: hypothetical protein A3G32_04570 [Deltaproteobacteria bacterium RIFCSPLOWO2_12_FULL_40_28]
MKQPKIDDLKIDQRGTKCLRAQMLKTHKIKITINLDSDLLSSVRKIAAQRGSPYQTFINHILREALANKKDQENRLDLLEKELNLIKKKLVA